MKSIKTRIKYERKRRREEKREKKTTSSEKLEEVESAAIMELKRLFEGGTTARGNAKKNTQKRFAKYLRAKQTWSNKRCCDDKDLVPSNIIEKKLRLLINSF